MEQMLWETGEKTMVVLRGICGTVRRTGLPRGFSDGKGVEDMEKKTPLYETHVKYGGKIVPFAGYLLPVQYKGGVIAEHMAVRTGCGLFDVSHMGEILCTGPDAAENLNRLLTNDFTGMYDGQARYSPMCNERGGIEDDLIVYKLEEDRYFIVVNACNKDKDFAWMKDHARGNAEFQDISGQVGQLALQGPLAKKILLEATDGGRLPTAYYSASVGCTVGGVPCMISRTGYTGEDGYELYMEADRAAELWEILMEAGKEDGLVPCGLGARDTLRLEAAMPLYGHEMDEGVTPLEAGLSAFVKMEKEDFIGKEALLAAGAPGRRRVGLKVTGRGIIREECPLFDGETQVGVTTSGTHAPYLKYPVAMALVDREHGTEGQLLTALVRGRKIEAQVVPLPFYKRKK